MSKNQSELLVSIGELTDEPVDQTGPNGPFIYVDISSIDRETKEITAPKTLSLDEVPSRAKQVLKAGDVLVSMTRPNLNAVALVPNHLDGAIGSTGFHVLRSRWLQPEFLFRLVQTQDFVDSMSAVVQGALYPAVRPKDISAYMFPFQPPKQQARIVEKLEELFSDLASGVGELKAAQKKLAQYRRSLLKAAVEGALTAEWRKHDMPTETGAELLERILTERPAHWEAKQLVKFEDQGRSPPKDWQKKYPQPVRPKTAELPMLPESWVWATLSQAGWLDRGRSKHRPRNAPHLYGGPYPFVQTGDIRHSDTFISSVEATYSEAGLAQSRLWPVGTMCITIAANIGETAILSMEACFPDSVVGFLPGTNEISIRYVEYFMRTIQEKLEDKAPATAQKNINLEILEKVAIPLPPIKEQNQIVEILDGELAAVAKHNRSIELGLKQSAAQRHNILRAAFSGQLVPQDPNDEPAGALLKRIRTERIERDQKPRLRKTRQQQEATAMIRKMIDVLAEAGDWISAQEAFRRSGAADGAETDQVEALYAELRELDKAGRLAVEAVTDAKGHKLQDRLKLLAA